MKKAMQGLKGNNKDLGPVPYDKDHIDDYKIDDAVSTLERAEKIKADEKLMPHVHKRISEKHRSLGDLKKLASKKSLEEQAAHEKGESAAKETKEDSKTT